MTKKRALLGVILLSSTGLCVALFFPRTHFAIIGWLRGEAFCDGLPTSYWAGALKKDPFIGHQGDVGKTLREAGTAGVPVLCQLLADDDPHVRWEALYALSLIDWDPRDVASTLTQLYVSGKGDDSMAKVIQKLAAKHPRVFGRELQWALDHARNPNRAAEMALALGSLGLDGWRESIQFALEHGTLRTRLEAGAILFQRTHETKPILPTICDALESSEPKVLNATLGDIVPEIAWVEKGALRPRLIELVIHESHVTRAEAVCVLGYVGPDRAVIDACLRALLDTSPDVREQAAWSLERLGPLDQLSRAHLRASLNDLELKQRLSSARLLLEDDPSRDFSVLATVVDVLRQSKVPDVRSEAASVLGSARVQSKEAIRALIEAVQNDPSPAVQKAAVESLKQIGPPADEATPMLVDLVLRGKTAARRVDAALALGMVCRNDRPVAALLAAVRNQSDPNLRAAAAGSLGAIGSHSQNVSAVLSGALNDRSPRVRCRAAEALAKVDPANRNSIGILMQSMTSSDPLEVADAVAALGNIGPAAKEAVPLLAKALTAQANVRAGAIRALAKIGPDAQAAVPLLIPLLKSRDGDDRCAAARAVWKIDYRSDLSVPVLLDYFKDKQNWEWRVIVADALREMGPAAKAAIPALRAATDDYRPEVRRSAAKALKRINGESG
jgi:HEAT repeat protein